MKLIGVTGRSGAGKTTFSCMLAAHDSVGLIHVDDLVGDVKYKYFKRFLKRDENNQIEKLAGSTMQPDNPKLTNESKRFFYGNKYAFNFLMWLRSRLISKSLNERIESFRQDGKKAVVIDDWVLDTHKDLYKKLDRIFYIERSFEGRHEGLIERDDLDREEIKIADMPYALKLVTKPNDERVITVLNKGTLQDLATRAENEYKKLNIQTFDEKYCVRIGNQKTELQRLLETLQKTAKARAEERERERTK